MLGFLKRLRQRGKHDKGNVEDNVKPVLSEREAGFSPLNHGEAQSSIVGLDQEDVPLSRFTRGKPVSLERERGRPVPEAVLPKPRDLVEPKRLNIKGRVVKVSLPEEVFTSLEAVGVNPRSLMEEYAISLLEEPEGGEEGAVLRFLRARLRIYKRLDDSVRRESERLRAEHERLQAEIKRLALESEKVLEALSELEGLARRLPRLYAFDERVIQRLEAFIQAQPGGVFTREEWDFIMREARAASVVMRGMRDPYAGATFQRLVRFLNRQAGLELPHNFWRGVFERYGGLDAWVRIASENAG